MYCVGIFDKPLLQTFSCLHFLSQVEPNYSFDSAEEAQWLSAVSSVLDDVRSANALLAQV